MSEGILKTLMQLFALVSTPNQNEENRRNIVRNYLSQQLNNKLVEEYLTLYDSYQQENEDKLREPAKIRKRFSANSVKILRIATKINEELIHYHKLIVLIQLLEFFNSGDDAISEIELDFANTIAETFNIFQDEYQSIYRFVTISNPDQLPGNNLLIVTSKKQHKNSDGYLYREHIGNNLGILSVPSGNLFLIKSGSGNDLMLNGQILQPNIVHYMRPGSSLRHNRATPITFTDISSRFFKSGERGPIVFSADDISFKYPKSEAGLNPMSFTTESGRLVGIMGDSGSGKTTLINILTGILEPSKGEVLINGVDIYENIGKVKGLIGYVAQDDLLIEDLTVYQNLYYNATLCFDHLSKPSISRKVLGFLKILGLYEIRDMKVGSPLNKKISGGQRKRLNIALELIREPAVLFLDEPTSGLSSRDSENIIDLLKELAQKGKLVFVVIHQPSSDIFKMFDQLLVLDSGGYLIYNGDAVEAISFFRKCINHVNKDENECSLCGNVNPEQILTIVNTHVLDEYGSPTENRKISAEEWHQLHKDSEKRENRKPVTSPLPDITFQIPNRFKQFFTFLTRDVLAKLSNKQYLLINLLESPALALLLASLILYFDVSGTQEQEYEFFNNPNLTVYIIISVIISIFIGLSVSAEEIISDRKILKRESFLNLSRLSYLVSKVVILGVLSAIQTGLFVLVGNSIMQIKDMGMAYWVILFSASVFANLLGLNISDSFKKTVNIYILIPFLIIPQLILSGVFISYDQLNPNLSSAKTIPWYGEMITARWAFEAIAVHQYKNNAYQENFFVYDKLKSKATYRKDFWFPELSNQVNRLNTAAESEKDDILKLLRNELKAHNALEMPAQHFNAVEKLTPSGYNKDIEEQLHTFLQETRQFYISLFNKADDALEEIKRQLALKHGVGYLTNLKNEHHNEDLERFVRRTNNIFANRVILVDNTLVQKFDPIYKDPDYSFIKAHFLSSGKRLGSKTYDTLIVNLAIIWIMNVLMFVLLYLGIFKRMFNLWQRYKKRYITRWLQEIN
jgi:ABC transport system ATP-binding/permease protein